METNFDLRKFLAENKLTTNSRNSVDEIGMFHDPRPSNLYTHYLAKIYKRDSSLKEADYYPNSSQVDGSDNWEPLVDKLFETLYQRIVSIPRHEMIDAITEFVDSYQGYDPNDKKGMFKAASHLFKQLSLDYLDENQDVVDMAQDTEAWSVKSPKQEQQLLAYVKRNYDKDTYDNVIDIWKNELERKGKLSKFIIWLRKESSDILGDAAEILVDFSEGEY